MIENSAHLGFIVAAYAVTVVVLAGLIGWIVTTGRSQRRHLADLEARGVYRRSAATKGAP